MSSSYQRYTDVLRDSDGNAVASATVDVFVGDSLTRATLYDGAGDPVSNPVTTDSNGRIVNDSESADPNDAIGFRAVGGRYRIEGTSGGESIGPIPDILLGNVQQYDQGTGDAQIPTNAIVATTLATVLSITGTDTYSVSPGRTVATGETIVGDVANANTGTAPTLNGDTVTTKDGSALWAGALSGIHTFQKAASSWLVLDPNPVSANSANAPVARDSNGRAKFADPSAAQDAATKAYVDLGPMVWEAVKTDTESTTSNIGSWVDVPGLSITLTPDEEDDDFLVEFNGQAATSGNANAAPVFRLVRGSTTLAEGDASASRTPVHAQTSYQGNVTGGDQGMSPVSARAVDAPATTSPITYKVQWSRGSNSDTSYLNRSADDSDTDNRPRGVSTLHVSLVRKQ